MHDSQYVSEFSAPYYFFMTGKFSFFPVAGNPANPRTFLTKNILVFLVFRCRFCRMSFSGNDLRFLNYFEKPDCNREKPVYSKPTYKSIELWRVASVTAKRPPRFLPHLRRSFFLAVQFFLSDRSFLWSSAMLTG